MRDHLMGYPPAAAEDFPAPDPWDYYERFGLGVPARMRGMWTVEGSNEAASRPVVRAVGLDHLTVSDALGLQRVNGGPENEEPDPVDRDEDDGPVPAPQPEGTLSPAAEWPFAEDGWANRLRQQRAADRVRVREMEREMMRGVMPGKPHGLVGGLGLYVTNGSGLAFSRDDKARPLAMPEPHPNPARPGESPEQWHARLQEQAKRDANTQCYTDNVRA